MTNEFRVHQKELDLARFFGPRMEDGGWRMEHCHVLTMWVNIVVSFDSARQILGGILTDCREILHCHKLETRSCLIWFVLYCCGSSTVFSVVLGRGGTVRGMMATAYMAKSQREADSTSWLSQYWRCVNNIDL